MNFFERILIGLKGKMPAPTNYGWFHLMFVMLAIAAIVLLCIFARNLKDKTFRRIIMWCWIVMLVLEIYKQLIYSVHEYDGQAYWRYQWYAFPFQLCSTPLYLLPFVAFMKEGKVRDSIISFICTFAMFGGLVVFLYPNDVFVETIGINFQTMIHHGLQLVLGIYIMVYYRKKLNWRFFASGIITFLIMCGVAMSLNVLLYNTIMVNNGQTFNMFYFSPYFPCTLALLGDLIWPNVPYIVFLLIYVIGFIIAAAIIFAIQYYIIKGVQKGKDGQ